MAESQVNHYGTGGGDAVNGRGWELYHDDCLRVLPQIEAGSVNLIATDLPYGSLDYAWDVVIPFPEMWKEINRVLSDCGTLITTSSNPFSALLIGSNLKQFKYSLVWKKSMGTNFLHAKNAAIKIHEDILVFSKGSINHPTVSDVRMTYNPQLLTGTAYKKKQDPRIHLAWNNQKRPSTNQPFTTVNNGFRYPTSVIEIPNGNNDNDGHPSQKPLALYEYLIRTYSNPGDLVLDFCMGSGTTGCAAIQTGRRFIGIEKDAGYFEIATKRIKGAQPPLFLDTPAPARPATQPELFA